MTAQSSSETAGGRKASKRRGPGSRVSMHGIRLMVEQGTEDMARSAMQRARKERQHWSHREWKAAMHHALGKFRKAIVHGGKRGTSSDVVSGKEGHQRAAERQCLHGPASVSAVSVVHRAAVGADDIIDNGLRNKICICTPIRFLGSGTFGKVYRCSARSGSAVGDEVPEIVAVKVLDKIDRSANEDQAILPTQIRMEIEHLAMLKGYDGVMQLLSWSEGIFDVQLVFQLYEEDLHTHIRRGGFHGQPGKFTRMCKQLLTGLSHIHGVKILHRDIKPANMMVSAVGDSGEQRAAISDLGSSIMMSGHVGSAASPVGTCDTEVTTYNYRAPELFFRGCQCNYPTDIWAMGVSIVQMDVGCVPFGKDVRKASQTPQIFFDQLSILYQTKRFEGWLPQNPGTGLKRLSRLQTAVASALPWGRSQGARTSQFQVFSRMFFQADPAYRPLAKDLAEDTFLQIA